MSLVRGEYQDETCQQEVGISAGNRDLSRSVLLVGTCEDVSCQWDSEIIMVKPVRGSVLLVRVRKFIRVSLVRRK